MPLSTDKQCAACVASRLRVVDAFMAGYRAGFRMAVAHTMTAIGQEMPAVHEFCLAHDEMITKAHVEEMKSMGIGSCET